MGFDLSGALYEFAGEPPTSAGDIIRVDRTVRPAYPCWMKEACHLKLEAVGPEEYRLAQVELWLHEGQKDDLAVTGYEIYGYLQRTDDPLNQLGLLDLEAIQRRGEGFFEEHFSGQVVYGWKGVIKDQEGDLCVPYLCATHDPYGERLPLRWAHLEEYWDASSPALRFHTLRRF